MYLFFREKIKKTICLFFLLASFCCNTRNDKLGEIIRLSKINIPVNSTVEEYYDNDEFQIAFKLNVRKSEIDNFLINKEIRQVDTTKKDKIKSISLDKIIINDIENSFYPQKNIFINKNLYIYKNNNTFLIINKKTCEIWGLINYN
jgi:hypothetical protein